MSVLENTRCYLSGAIENDPSPEHNWRTTPKKILCEKYKINVFDPFDDPKQQWVPSLNKARQEEDYDLIKKICKNFVRKDLCMVDRSDFIIAYLPYKVPTTGTHHEIINSANAKKPTLLVVDKENISYLPLWYFGFIPIEFMFAGWDNLYSYLDEVNEGKHKHNDKWDFIYGNI